MLHEQGAQTGSSVGLGDVDILNEVSEDFRAFLAVGQEVEELAQLSFGKVSKGGHEVFAAYDVGVDPDLGSRLRRQGVTKVSGVPLMAVKVAEEKLDGFGAVFVEGDGGVGCFLVRESAAASAEFQRLALTLKLPANDALK